MRSSRIHASTEGDSSYLGMWKKAVDRDRKSTEFERIAGNIGESRSGGEEEEEAEQSMSPEELERKTEEFMKILEVSTEERDRIQGMQVIDRAAAAIAAAKSLLKEDLLSKEKTPFEIKVEDGTNVEDQEGGNLTYFVNYFFLIFCLLIFLPFLMSCLVELHHDFLRGFEVLPDFEFYYTKFANDSLKIAAMFK